MKRFCNDKHFLGKKPISNTWMIVFYFVSYSYTKFCRMVFPFCYCRAKKRWLARPGFRENKTKTLVFSHWKRALWACFRESWVYNFGHGCLDWIQLDYAISYTTTPKYSSVKDRDAYKTICFCISWPTSPSTTLLYESMQYTPSQGNTRYKNYYFLKVQTFSHCLIA